MNTNAVEMLEPVEAMISRSGSAPFLRPAIGRFEGPPPGGTARVSGQLDTQERLT